VPSRVPKVLVVETARYHWTSPIVTAAGSPAAPVTERRTTRRPLASVSSARDPYIVR
jgi:hypothetical protein